MESCEFILGPSRFLSALFYFIYLGAAILLLLADLPLLTDSLSLEVKDWMPACAGMTRIDLLSLGVRLGGIALITRFLSQTLSLHVKRLSAKSVLALWQDSKGRWGCHLRNGQCYRGILSKDSFQSSLLVVLRLCTFHRVITILIPFDAMEPNEYRVLCSRLLFFP